MNAVYGIYKYCHISTATQSVKAVLLKTEPMKYYKDSICHEYSKRNIGTTKTMINLRVRVTPNLGRMVVYE